MSSFDGLLERAKKNYSDSFSRDFNEPRSGSTQAAVSTPQRTVTTSSFDGLFERAKANYADSFRSEEHRSTVVDWMDRYNRVVQGVSAYDKKRNGGYTQDASGGFGTEIDSLIAEFDNIKGYAADYGFMNSGNYLDQLKQLQNSIQGINGNFSQFEDEDAYNRYLEYWNDQEEKRNLDLDAYSREIAQLEQQLEDYDPQIDWTNPTERKQYDAGLKELEDEINRRKQYLAQAQRLQKKDEFSAVANPESEKYDAAFDSKSGYVSTELDDRWQRAVSQYAMGYGDLVYEYINNREGVRDQIRKKTVGNDGGEYGEGWESFESRGYDYMTEDEVGLYNYYYSMGGKDSAQAYLDTIQDDLMQRRAGVISGELKGRTAAELAFGIGAGLDQFGSSMKSLARGIKGEDSYVAPSATQYASGMVREDLADDGFKLPSLLGGASLGQIGYDAITTIANMAPSILTGMASNAVLPGSGTVVSSTLLGGGATGGAYQEAINEGFSVDQARGYGILSGASEIVMEKVLGGISAYGGNALGKYFTQNMKNADTALKRIAKELGGSMLSEFSEEYLQEVLTPVFQNLTLGTDNEVKLVSSEALYAGFLGAITGGIMEGPQAIANARNATEVPGNATVDNSLATDPIGNATGKNGLQVKTAPKVGVSKMETVQVKPDMDSFAQQFGTQAEAVKRNYLEGQDLQEYQVGFQTAYSIGLEGGKKEALGKVPYLSQSQKEIAFSLGRDAAAAQKAAAPKKAAVTAKMTTEEGTQDVTIAEVVDMDDTTMTFRLEDGRTVTDNDLDFEKGQKLMAAAWELGMDVKAVNTIVTESAANTAADADQAAGIQQAHHYGQYGYTMDQLTKHGKDAAALTDVQRKAAWEAGRQIYLQKAAEPSPAVKAPRTSGVWFDNGGGDVIAFEDYDISGIPQSAVAGARAAQVLQKLGIGRNYYFFESYKNKAGERVYRDENGIEKKAPNGWYDPTDGSIHIDLRAGADGKGLTLYTLSHELTHYVEKEDKQAYRRLAEFLVANYAKHGNVDAMVAEKQAELNANREKGQEVSYEKAYSEFIADSMEAMLSDGNVLEKLQELKKTDRSLFDKIKEFFDGLVKKIREIYRDLKPDSLEGQAVLQMKDQIGQIQQLFAEALAETSSASEPTYLRSETVQMQNATTAKPTDTAVQETTVMEAVNENAVQKDTGTVHDKYRIDDDFTAFDADPEPIEPNSVEDSAFEEHISEENLEKKQEVKKPDSETKQDPQIPSIDKDVTEEAIERAIIEAENQINENELLAKRFRPDFEVIEAPTVFYKKHKKDIDFYKQKHEGRFDSAEDPREVYPAEYSIWKKYMELWTESELERQDGNKRAYYQAKAKAAKERLERLRQDADDYRRAKEKGKTIKHWREFDPSTSHELTHFAEDQAGENFQAAAEVGLKVDAETRSVAPSAMYSERTWRESDYVQERSKAAEEIHKAIGVPVEKAKQYIDSVNSIAKMIAEDRTRLDYFSSPNRSSFIGNVEYGGSFDFSTLCKKRRLLTGTFTAIQKALPNTALTANEILDIRNRMKEAGLEVSCGLCYVEGSRANMGQFAKEFLRLYKQYYPDAWQPNMADVNTPDGIEWVRINHPECYEQYEYFWNHYGTLKAGDKNLFASQQKPKLYQLHTEYKGEILQKFKGDDNVEEKNLNGGIRLQSFSDFEIVHLIDTMQIIMDMSRVGLAGQAYTKVPDFAWALGDTGLKINLSLIAKGVDESGNLIFDDIEGMPIAEAMKLRDRYSANVGTILVAFNDAQLMAAMADDRVDFIIPFHRSQWKKSQYEAMGLPAKTKDYTFMQNEKFIKPQYHEYRGRMVKDKATNYMPNEYWDFSKTGKENAEAYLQMCARNNKRPKFYKLLQNNGDGSYSLKADGSTDGYWKLLIDFKMYDNDGNGSPQAPVRPEFNMAEATRMLDDYKGGHSNFPVAQGIVDSFVSEYKENHGDRMYSDRKKPGEYGGIREVLAKKGLDELSEKLRDRFPLSAKFDETMRNDGTELVMENISANSVAKGRKESAYKVGRKAFTSKYGAKTRVHIAQMGIDADLYADVANESISKAIGQRNEQSTLDVIPHIGDILSNSILMGIERIAHTDNKGTALYGYRLYNLYWYIDGNKKTPHALVCTVVQDLNKAEGYVFKNIENVTIGRGLPGTYAGMSSSVNGDTYTVAQLYDAVKKIDRNEGGLKYSDADRNYLFSFTERDDGVAYQDRASGTSNRDLLAGAFEDLARSPAEMEFLREYQENVGKLNEQERKLQEIRMEIRELTFGKGPKDPKRLEKLQEEAGKTANRIHIYDKKLLQLEAAKPLRDVLDREREKVRKATRQKGQEAMAEYREKRKESAARKDAKRKIRKTVMELDKLLNRGDKKKNVKSGMTSMVDCVLKLADALFMDEYTNRDMLRNGVGVELTDAEEKLFREAQQILQQAESGAAIEGMEFTSEVDAMNQLKKLDQKLSSKMSGLKDVFARERKRLYGTTVSDLLGKLADEYSRLSEAEDGAVRAAKDENVYAHLLQLQKDVGGTTVRDMTLGQMEAVADAFTMVLTTVRNANKMFAKNLKFKRDTLAGMVMSEVGAAVKKISKMIRPGKNAVDTFSWNNLKPVYAFERLGSQTLKTLFGNIRKGQDVWSRDMQEADDFRREQYRKHNRKAWDLEKQHRFEFESGIVDLSLEQIMSLYAYSRREQALDHLLKGGFVFSGNTEVMVKKNGIQRRYLKKDATAYNLTADELLQVVDTLTKEQKAFVEEMQTYLSDVMGGKGNEISLQMYGIRSYGEKNYFPIRSAGQYMERAKEDSFRKEQGQISIVNSGFTKSTTPKANNPITLDGFMNVWAEHVNEMSMYHGFALPMEDFRRVYNYSSPNMEVGNSQSVNAVIENAFGKAATGYIDQLYKDLNGGALTDNREGISKKLVGLHKKAAVFASASVVVQQPSAIVRAFALIDPRHFIGPKVDRKRHKQLWEEVKKYAPVAFVKEMGYFDTGMGRSARDFLQAEEYSGIREKMTALFKDADYRDEILGKAPALADELTWCSIWEAVKRETKAKNPDLDVRSDAFLQIAGARFSEVIDKTQVYDSVLSRSANMRSKSGLMNMVTSFLAEPTTSINMLEDALRKGDRQQLKRTVGAVYGSVLLNSLLVSLVYAARDDDEDETWWEKYLSSVAVEMMDGINPITYYPILRDIWSIGQGFDVERADMTLISDFADAAKKVVQAAKKVQEASEEEHQAAMGDLKDSLWGMTDTVASLTGLPLKNIRRDIEGAVNLYRTISTDLAGRKTTALSLQDTVLADVMGSIPIGNLLYSKNKRQKLYDAIVAGDAAYVQRLKAGYDSEDSYHTAIKQALRDYDSRIWEAAVAWNANDLGEYLRLCEEIVAEEHFDSEDIYLAAQAEASSMLEKESDPSTKVRGKFTNEKFGVALGQNNTGMADIIRKDLIDTAMANGKTRDEAEDSFRNTARSKVKQLFADGTITGSNAQKLLVKYGDYDQADAADRVAEWKFEKDYPDSKISYDSYQDWLTNGKNRGVTLEVYTDVSLFRKPVGVKTAKAQEDVAAYINNLPISTAQKDALWCCFWSESTLYKNAPWH